MGAGVSVRSRVARATPWTRLRSLAVSADVAVVLAAVLLGAALSRATTRVAGWFVMTDELLYERLAISVARGGSLLPHVHDELIPNVNQLYPLLLSLVYGDGNVPQSLDAAHLVNAFVMASTAVPAFLLARFVVRRPLVSMAVGILAVTVPWIVLSSFLLTEVVAYPAFTWAILAITYAVAKARTRYDVLALLAVAVTITARTQFVVLLAVLPLAVVVDAALAESAAGRRGTALARATASTLLRTRRPLVALYALALAVLAVAVAVGQTSSLLGSYAIAARDVPVDADLLTGAAQHLAAMSLAFALLPFFIGLGWAIARLRPAVQSRERAFAVVAVVTVAALTLEVASFDERFGGGVVRDRYLFYVAPLLLVLFAAALFRGPVPRWTILVPGTVCVLGFATLPLPLYDKLNVDSPAAILNNELVDTAGSAGWARAALVLATVVVAAAFLQLGPRPVAFVSAGALLVVLPAQTVYAFHRLFAVDGTSGLPITLRQGHIYNWIDGAVGPDASVTMIPYPIVRADYWATAGFWWDLEFWNESVDQTATVNGAFSFTPSSFATADLRFDPTTGLANRTGHEYVAAAVSESRFGLLAARHAVSRDVQLLVTARPWRAAWVSYGLYHDGWTRPGRTATIRIFAHPDQAMPVNRFLSLAVLAPDGVDRRPFTATWPGGRSEAAASEDDTTIVRLTVCVPPRGYTDVRVTTPAASATYGDLVNQETFHQARPVGVLLRQIGLADETAPADACPRPRA